jgi:hypothetical protein
MSLTLPRYDHSFKGAITLSNWLKKEKWYVPRPEVAAGTILPTFKNKVEDYRGGKSIVIFKSDDLKNTSICIERDGIYQIVLPKGFNFCHQKFAVCKELCHILTDDGTYKSHEPIEQLTRALQTNRKVLTSPKDRELSLLFTEAKLSAEDFCFLLALEILIPVEKRDQIITDVKVSGIKKPYDIALELHIPSSLVEFFIESDYNAVFKRLGGHAL